MQRQDADILKGMLGKDEKALEEVYSIFYGQLCYFGEKLTGQRLVSEEIVVDVFVNVFRSGIRFDNMTHLRSYLFQAVKNRCINFLKQEKKKSRDLALYLEKMEESIANADTEMVELEVLELIFAASGALPAECRRIFDLLYKEHLSYQEIAERLNLNVQTVRNQNARAIATLRKILSASPS